VDRLPVRLFLFACVAIAGLVAPRVHAAPSVWVIDDGEKIRRDATSTPFERGEGNPVWRPGEPVRVFALRNESVAIQVVVEADDAALAGVTVSLPKLDGPNGATMVEDVVRPVAALEARDRVDGPQRPIERFVEHFVVVRRQSGGRTPGESLGWERGAAPPAGAWVGPVPDALIPVEAPGPWRAYPVRIEPHENGIVWVDLNVPRDQAPGMYLGTVDVREGARPLAALPVELDVVDAVLPDRTVATILFYDPEEVEKRVGSAAEAHLWKLLHAHRIAPLHDATSKEDIDRQRMALDGTLYTQAHGYTGPAIGKGDGVLSLGAYGALGAPDSEALARVATMADAIATDGLFDSNGVFLYAADERCSSPWGAGWSDLLRGAANPNVRRVRVAWTCSNDPAAQPVDIPILLSAYDASQAKAARARGKSVWVYNGVLPRAGTFLLDADAVSPRVNGWLGAMYDIERWFYWESTYWYGLHGRTPIDPFAAAESLHNDDGDWANGDGVLLYPGRQIDRFQTHSLGFEGVVASIRLKNWRRGIEDAGYFQLARARDPVRAADVARRLIPAAFADARKGSPAGWAPRGQPFFDARRALLSIARGETVPPQRTSTVGRWSATMGAGAAAILGAATALFGALYVRRRRQGRRN
jgi:hypothetical protein